MNDANSIKFTQSVFPFLCTQLFISLFFYLLGISVIEVSKHVTSVIQHFSIAKETNRKPPVEFFLDKTSLVDPLFSINYFGEDITFLFSLFADFISIFVNID